MEVEKLSSTRSKPLVIVLAAFCAGIVIDRYVPLAAAIWWYGAVISLIVWWLRRWRRYAAGALCLSIVFAGAFAHHLQWKLYLPTQLARYAREFSTPVCLEVVALGPARLVPAPPDDPLCSMPRSDYSKLTVRALQVRDGRQWRPVSGRGTLMVFGPLLDISAGDRLRIYAQLAKPKPALNPGQIDFARLERGHRRLYRLIANNPACVSVLSRASPWRPDRWLHGLRSLSSDMLWRHLSHQRGGLAAAVLLGARDQLGSHRIEAFVHTGTIHLLAISGLHVGILASGFFLLARTTLLPVRSSIVAAMLLTVTYALLTEARAPVIRATILVCVTCCGLLARRRTSVFNSLAAAALVVLGLRPSELFQAGAQLSFLAVATLAVVGCHLAKPAVEDPLKKLIQQSRPLPIRATRALLRKILHLLLASVAVWLVTLPLVLYQFHIVSPAAIALNVVLWIPVTLALFFGFGVIVFGWLIPPLAAACGWVCDANLWLLESVVRTIQPIHGSHFWCVGPALWWMIGFYILIAYFGPNLQRARKRLGIVAITILWLVVGLVMPRGSVSRLLQDEGLFRCTFLSVGHGTCVVMELPDGECVIYDAGNLGPPSYGVNTVSKYLWCRGIGQIHKLILSHADVDHYNAVPALVERFRIDNVYVTSSMFEDPSDAIEQLEIAVKEKGIPIEHLRQGVGWRQADDVEFRVLHPPHARIEGGDNANSIVLEVAYGEHRIILPGDIEAGGLDRLLATPQVDCNVAMAPHHGSRNSDPARFLKWCTPEWVAISGGSRDGVDNTLNAFRDFGCQAVHTAVHGAIEVQVRPNEIRVDCWRVPPPHQRNRVPW